MSGDTVQQLPVYGTRGVPAKENSPGSRQQAVSWSDNEGGLWLMGGVGRSINEFYWNEVWRWEDGLWTWVSGDNSGKKVNGVYGTMGIPDPKNHPGSRQQFSHTQANGILYIFGGFGVDEKGKTGFLSDLWKCEDGIWTWLGGKKTAGEFTVYGAKGIADKKSFPGGRNRASFWYDGNAFWIYGGSTQVGSASVITDDLWRWDGNLWTWVGGNKGTYGQVVHGKKRRASSSNTPGSRARSSAWIDKGGNLILFGGYYSPSRGSTIQMSDLWQWDGQNWTWVNGPKTEKSYGSYLNLEERGNGNEPGARVEHAFTIGRQGEAWVFGGLGYAKDQWGRMHDLWQCDGEEWTWMQGDGLINQPEVWGKKEVQDKRNTPGSRVNAVHWIDSNGDLWLYGGASTTSGATAGLWKLEKEPVSRLYVKGNSIVIEPDDDTPRKNDNTHFGTIAIDKPPVVRTFVIENGGNTQIDLTGNPLVELGGNDFILLKVPGKKSLQPGDTTHFTVLFAPSKEGYYQTQLEIQSTDKKFPNYRFLLSGNGGPPSVELADSIFCSRISLNIRDHSSEHHTVIVSDSGKTELPIDGKNYSHNLHYLKAPVVSTTARVVYQGKDPLLYIEGLIAGRSYEVKVVPGTGSGSGIAYQFDSVSTLYFRTPKAPWESSLKISPAKDSIYCVMDSVYSKAISPYKVLWMDAVRIPERAIETGQHYFLSQGDDQCWVSSDTVNHVVNQQPVFDSIKIIGERPWCPGDAIELQIYGNNSPVSWFGGLQGSSRTVQQSGTYLFESSTGNNCALKDSIEVKFDRQPEVAFVDSNYEYFDAWDLIYTTNTSQLSWSFNNQEYGYLDSIVPSASGVLVVSAINQLGCRNTDTLQVRVDKVVRAIPNAFSPDGNNVNDVWSIQHENNTGVLTVFGRDGGIVHKGTNQWTGRIFGTPVPSGTYFFTYEIEGEEEVLSGIIHVIR